MQDITRFVMRKELSAWAAWHIVGDIFIRFGKILIRRKILVHGDLLLLKSYTL